MVANHGGFSEASRRLHVVPSVVAKRVSQLEKTVGAQLFLRSTRSTSLTEAGHRLQSEAADLLAGFDEVVHLFKRDANAVEGHIRVSAPTTLNMVFLGDVFSSFLQAHPYVTLEVSLADRSTNPLEEGVDVAISGRSASYDGVVDIPLCSVRPLLCASPAYLERRGVPKHPRELMEHDCLVFKVAGSNWSFQSPGGILTVDISAKLTADDNVTLLHAAVAGCGIAIVPQYVARTALTEGALQIVLPEFPPQENWFKVYVPRRKQEIARIKALLQWLTLHMARLVEVESAFFATRIQPPSVKPKPKRKR